MLPLIVGPMICGQCSARMSLLVLTRWKRWKEEGAQTSTALNSYHSKPHPPMICASHSHLIVPLRELLWGLTALGKVELANYIKLSRSPVSRA